jgi:biopolymer transport protein ExbD
MEHVLPPKDESDDAIEPEDSIYIAIYPSQQFEMDKTTYSIDQVSKIYNYVNQKVQVNAKKPIIVHTNPEAEYGDMVAVLNQLKQLQADLEQPLAITIPSKKESERYTQTMK